MDASVYVRLVGENKVYLTVYVIDLLIVGIKTDIKMILAELQRKFKIKGFVHCQTFARNGNLILYRIRAIDFLEGLH